MGWTTRNGYVFTSRSILNIILWGFIRFLQGDSTTKSSGIMSDLEFLQDIKSDGMLAEPVNWSPSADIEYDGVSIVWSVDNHAAGATTTLIDFSGTLGGTNLVHLPYREALIMGTIKWGADDATMPEGADDVGLITRQKWTADNVVNEPLVPWQHIHEYRDPAYSDYSDDYLQGVVYLDDGESSQAGAHVCKWIVEPAGGIGDEYAVWVYLDEDDHRLKLYSSPPPNPSLAWCFCIILSPRFEV